MNSARIVRLSLAVIVLVMATHSTFAMLRGVFSVNAAWPASHIVVVETTPIDGAFEVVESWKGDLAVGSRIVIPELIPAANAIPLSGYPEWPFCPDGRCDIAEQIPKQPLGSRIVLFLKRNKVDPTNETGTKRREWSGWPSWPAGDADEMKISAVWIDGERTHSFQMRGPMLFVLSVRGEIAEGELRFVPESEERLKQAVAEILRVQEEMKTAIAETSGRGRALRLKSYASSKIYMARMFALEELGKAGPAAVGTIGEMLDDPAFANESRELIRAMVQAGGDAAGSELNRRLEGDLAFWKYTGPSLSPGWGDKDPDAESSPRARYNRTSELIYGLEQAKYAGALNTAIQMRDLWRTLPLRDENSEQNQIVEECDKLIALLQTK